jgi:hypothetical protein
MKINKPPVRESTILINEIYLVPLSFRQRLMSRPSLVVYSNSSNPESPEFMFLCKELKILFSLYYKTLSHDCTGTLIRFRLSFSFFSANVSFRVNRTLWGWEKGDYIIQRQLMQCNSLFVIK